MLHDPLRDRQAKAEAAALGRDEVVEDLRQPFRRNARAGVRHADLHLITIARGGDGDVSARRRGLNGVRDQITIDPAECKAIGVDHQRLGRIPRFDRDADALAFDP